MMKGWQAQNIRTDDMTQQTQNTGSIKKLSYLVVGFVDLVAHLYKI